MPHSSKKIVPASHVISGIPRRKQIWGLSLTSLPHAASVLFANLFAYHLCRNLNVSIDQPPEKYILLAQRLKTVWSLISGEQVKLNIKTAPKAAKIIANYIIGQPKQFCSSWFKPKNNKLEYRLQRVPLDIADCEEVILKCYPHLQSLAVVKQSNSLSVMKSLPRKPKYNSLNAYFDSLDEDKVTNAVACLIPLNISQDISNQNCIRNLIIAANGNSWRLRFLIIVAQTKSFAFSDLKPIFQISESLLAGVDELNPNNADQQFYNIFFSFMNQSLPVQLAMLMKAAHEPHTVSIEEIVGQVSRCFAEQATKMKQQHICDWPVTFRRAAQINPLHYIHEHMVHILQKFQLTENGVFRNELLQRLRIMKNRAVPKLSKDGYGKVLKALFNATQTARNVESSPFTHGVCRMMSVSANANSHSIDIDSHSLVSKSHYKSNI